MAQVVQAGAIFLWSM